MKKEIDERDPKEILKTELYLTAPMIRRVLNCGYNKALDIINLGLEIEKSKELFIVNKRIKQIRTSTFRELMKL